MRLMRRMVGSFSGNSRVFQARSVLRRVRAAVGVERLEGRDLPSIPGVSLVFGNLAITATKTSGNNAQVSIDSSTKNVQITFNGQSEEFSPSSVLNVTYKGGSGGGDTFVDNTGLVSLAYGYGGNNNFTGGSSYNYVYFWGNSNTFTGPTGSISEVIEHGGLNDVVNKLGTVTVYPNS